MVGQVLMHDLAIALSIPEERLAVVEVRLNGEYVIFDVLDAPAPSSSSSSSASSSAASASSSAASIAPTTAAAATGRGPNSYTGVSVDDLRTLLVALVAVPSSDLYTRTEVGHAVVTLDGVSAIDDEGRARPLPPPSLELARLALLAEHARHMSAREWVFVIAVTLALLSYVARWLHSRRCCADEAESLRLAAKPGYGAGGRQRGQRGSGGDDSALLDGSDDHDDDDDDDEEEDEGEGGGRLRYSEAAARASLDAKRSARSGKARRGEKKTVWPPPPGSDHINPFEPTVGYLGSQSVPLAPPSLPPPPPTAPHAYYGNPSGALPLATPAQDLLRQLSGANPTTTHVDDLLGPPTHPAVDADGSGGVLAGGFAGPTAQERSRWCQIAYDELHASLAAALREPETDPQLFRRLCNRNELRLILSTPEDSSRLTSAQQRAWETSGLLPNELRAILHALSHVCVINSKPAQQFRRRLEAEVEELAPPPESRGGDSGGELMPKATVPGSADSVLRL